MPYTEIDMKNQTVEYMCEELIRILNYEGGSARKYIGGRDPHLGPYGISIFTEDEIDAMLGMVLSIRNKYRHLTEVEEPTEP